MWAAHHSPGPELRLQAAGRCLLLNGADHAALRFIQPPPPPPTHPPVGLGGQAAPLKDVLVVGPGRGVGVGGGGLK